MDVRLVIEKGRKRKVVHLRSHTATLGRSHGNTVRIPSSEVSRKHCRLLQDHGILKVEDLESVNGTFLNGDLITGVAVVRPGDRLEVGPVQFVVEYDLSPEALNRLMKEEYEVVEEEGAEAEPMPTFDEPAQVPMDDDETSLRSGAAGRPAVDAEEMLEVVGDDGWKPPEGGDIRDILSQLDDDESPSPKGKKGKEKKPAKKPKKPEVKRRRDEQMLDD